jgi:hypothetical protein
VTRSELEIIIKKRAAIVITTLAALLAINTYVGSSLSSKIMNNTVAANDLWSWYQVKNVRTAIFNGLADMVEQKHTPENMRLSQHYRSEIHRLRTEPGDGMEALAAKARELELERDHAKTRSPFYTYAGSALQISIVLSTAAILAVAMPLFWASCGVGAIGAGLFLFGFFGV